VAGTRTNQVSTVGVEFSSVVISGNVDQGLINETSPLDIFAGHEHLDTSESTSRDETGAIARLAAPGDYFAFGVTNSGAWLWRGPEAEVF